MGVHGACSASVRLSRCRASASGCLCQAPKAIGLWPNQPRVGSVRRLTEPDRPGTFHGLRHGRSRTPGPTFRPEVLNQGSFGPRASGHRINNTPLWDRKGRLDPFWCLGGCLSGRLRNAGRGASGQLIRGVATCCLRRVPKRMQQRSLSLRSMGAGCDLGRLRWQLPSLPTRVIMCSTSGGEIARPIPPTSPSHPSRPGFSGRLYGNSKPVAYPNIHAGLLIYVRNRI